MGALSFAYREIFCVSPAKTTAGSAYTHIQEDFRERDLTMSFSFDKQVSAYGNMLPLAFVYDDVAYYFDIDELDDAKTTLAVSTDGAQITGLDANKALVSAIHRYGEERHKVWMSKWFADCVSYELEEG